MSESGGWVQCGECTHQFDAAENGVQRSDLLGESILASMADMTVPEQGFNVEQLEIDAPTEMQPPADFADYSQTEMIDLFEPPPLPDHDDHEVDKHGANDDYYVDDEDQPPFPEEYGFREGEHYDNAEIIAHSVDEFRQQSLSVRSQVSESSGGEKPTEEESMVFGEHDLAVDQFHRQLDDVPAPDIAADRAEQTLEDEESTLVVDDIYDDLQPSSKTPWGRIAGLSVSIPLITVLIAMLLFQLQQRQIIDWLSYDVETLMTERWFRFLDKGDSVKTDLAKIHLSSTRMEPHISKQGAVTVVLQLINRAGFNQVYPDLEVSFTNDDGKVLSRRVVRPFEYLPQQQLNMLESQQARSLRLHFDQLPKGAVGYEIRITRRTS